MKLLLNKWRILLVVLLLWHLVWNIFWISKDQSPLPWDSANHARLSLEIIREVSAGKPWNILRVSDYYPPFVHSLSAMVFLFIRNTDTASKLVATSWFLVSISSLYAFTLTYTKKENLAFWTAALFSFFPIAYGESHFLLLDLPATALTLTTMIFLEKSNLFTGRKYTILSFISVSALALTKWAGLPFAFAPFFVYTLKLLWEWNERALANYLLGLILAFALVSPWYLINIPSLFFNLTLYTTGESVDPIKLWSLTNFSHYFTEYLNRQVTPFAGGFFAIIVFAVAITRKFIKENISSPKIAPMLGYLAFYYVVFTFISNKDPRYTLPALPYVALVTILSFSWISTKSKILTQILAGLFSCYFVIYFLVLNLRPSSLENYELPIRVPILEWIRIIDVSDKLVKKPGIDNWSVTTLIEDLSNLEEDAIVHTAVDFEHFNPLTLNYSTRKFQLQRRIESDLQFRLPDIYTLIINFDQPFFADDQQILQYFETGDYVILTDGNFGPFYLRHFLAVDQLRFYLNGHSFKKCSDFITKILPEGEWCYLDKGSSLITDSDIVTYQGLQQGNDKLVEGFTRVACPWACSFRKPSFVATTQIEKTIKPFDLHSVKSYQLPNGEIATLYKIMWDQEYTRKKSLLHKPTSHRADY